MQTFLPYSNFPACAIVLDDKRLNKQVLEAHQIIRTIDGFTTGWQHHPVVKMWGKYREALVFYTVSMMDEAIRRGFKCKLRKEYTVTCARILWPHWNGEQLLHESHRSNLLQKYPAWYSQFGWEVRPDMLYYWPED